MPLAPEAFATGYSDAAKRMADTVTLHSLTGAWLRWCAIRLSDGGSDGVIYDTRADAVRHQLHETLCAYIRVPPGGMAAREAEAVLAYHRAVYDAGFRLPDPEAFVPLMPLTRADQRRQIRALTDR